MTGSPRRHARRDAQGRLLVAYEQVDPGVTYFRKTWGEWRDEDAGLWLDLDPDIPPTLAVPLHPLWLLDQVVRDGPVRAALMDLGVSRAEWEAATPAQREAVISALKGVQYINETVRAVIKGADNRLRTRRVKALLAFGRRAEADSSEKTRKALRGYEKRRERLATAHRLRDFVNDALVAAQKEARAAPKHGNLFNKTNWVDGIVEFINFTGTMISMPRRVRCTRADVLVISGRRGTAGVAEEIVKRTYPELSDDALDRGMRDRAAKPAPHSGANKVGKKAVSGPSPRPPPQ